MKALKVTKQADGKVVTVLLELGDAKTCRDSIRELFYPYGALTQINITNEYLLIYTNESKCENDGVAGFVIKPAKPLQDKVSFYFPFLILKRNGNELVDVTEKEYKDLTKADFNTPIPKIYITEEEPNSRNKGFIDTDGEDGGFGGF